MPEAPVGDIARTIQLAIAPVFLLTALGTMLSVFSARLGRIVDRARLLGDRMVSAPADRQASLRDEIVVLGVRRRLVHVAITCATLAALLVCVMIAVAFVGSILHMATAQVIAGLFILVMAAFITALVYFLREILTAVSHVRAHSEDTLQRVHGGAE
jgi:sterol desaturase/sphingolipid hydroxylase (fatty acid hydroxylase superfamily)